MQGLLYIQDQVLHNTNVQLPIALGTGFAGVKTLDDPVSWAWLDMIFIYVPIAQLAALMGAIVTSLILASKIHGIYKRIRGKDD